MSSGELFLCFGLRTTQCVVVHLFKTDNIKTLHWSLVCWSSEVNLLLIGPNICTLNIIAPKSWRLSVAVICFSSTCQSEGSFPVCCPWFIYFLSLVVGGGRKGELFSVEGDLVWITHGTHTESKTSRAIQAPQAAQQQGRLFCWYVLTLEKLWNENSSV